MKVKEAKQLVKTIRAIYKGQEDPKKFAELSGLHDTYLEELWPSDPSKLVGDWISKRFDVKLFLDESLIKEFCTAVSNQLKEVLFYANLPDRETFNQRVREMQELNDSSSSTCKPS